MSVQSVSTIMHKATEYEPGAHGASAAPDQSGGSTPSHTYLNRERTYGDLRCITAQGKLDRLSDADRATTGYLGDIVASMYDRQLEKMPTLAEQITTFEQYPAKYVQIADSLGATTVALQFNPNREKRTKAPWQNGQVHECFLDPEALAPDQLMLLLGNMAVGANPFPATSAIGQHLNNIHQKHTPQSFYTALGPSLQLARALGPGFFTFFNAVDAGASAPQHTHVQSGQHEAPLPIEINLRNEGRLLLSGELRNGTQVKLARHLSGSAIEVSSADFHTVNSSTIAIGARLANPAMRSFLSPRQNGSARPAEPVVNMLTRFGTDGIYRVMLVPRQRETPNNLGVAEFVGLKPASLEAAGIFVVGTTAAYEKIAQDPDRHLGTIYNSVLIPPDRVVGMLQELSGLGKLKIEHQVAV